MKTSSVKSVQQEKKARIGSDPLGWLLASLQPVCALPSTPSALDFSGCFERQKESW